MAAKRPTIHDVARLCGVSTATVSRVLNAADYPVSAALRERVLAAANELHYTPNLFGKALKTSSSRDLGVIVPNMTNPYYAMLLQGVYDVALKEEYHVILCSANRDPKLEAESLRTLRAKQVDGILLASINADPSAVEEALRFGCPVVAMEQAVTAPCIQVGFDYRQGAYLATKHLVEHGHQRIGFIGAPLDRPSRRSMLAGYLDCLKEYGCQIREEDIMLPTLEQEQTQVYEFANGAACAEAFCAMVSRPTGFVCINDMTALGAMGRFSDKGLRIPEDVSVIGFDNIPYCEISTPALSTIDQHAYEMGSMSARLIIEHIRWPEKAQYSVTLMPTLIERASVAAARPV